MKMVTRNDGDNDEDNDEDEQQWRSQGITIDNIVINVTYFTNFTTGLFYVAWSRFKHEKGLHFICNRDNDDNDNEDDDQNKNGDNDDGE